MRIKVGKKLYLRLERYPFRVIFNPLKIVDEIADLKPIPQFTYEFDLSGSKEALDFPSSIKRKYY